MGSRSDKHMRKNSKIWPRFHEKRAPMIECLAAEIAGFRCWQRHLGSDNWTQSIEKPNLSAPMNLRPFKDRHLSYLFSFSCPRIRLEREFPKFETANTWHFIQHWGDSMSQNHNHREDWPKLSSFGGRRSLDIPASSSAAATFQAWEKLAPARDSRD